MNVIDTLVVTLGLDSSNYVKNAAVARAQQKKMTDEERQAAKDAEQFTKQRTEAYRKLGAEVLGLFAIFSAGRGAEQFVREITSSDAAVGRMAHNLDMSTDTLAAWQGAAELAGGSAAGIAGSFQNLESDFQQFLITGQSNVLPFFKSMHIDVADATNKIRPLGDLLLDLADKFHAMDPARAQSFGASMGLDTNTINMLEQGRAAVQGLLDRSRQLGVPHDSDATNAQNLLRDIKEAQLAVTDLVRGIINDLSEPIHNLLKQMDDWIAKNKQWLAQKIAEEIERLAAALAEIPWQQIGDGLAAFGTGVTRAVDGLNDWVGATEILFGVWAGAGFIKMLTNIGLLRAGVAAAIAGTIAFGARSLDAWLDTTHPWASDLDNWLHDKLGLGHSYQQQREQFGGAAGHAAPPPLPKGEQDAAARKAFQWYTDHGLPATAAAGVVAGHLTESGMNPRAEGDKVNGVYTAYGLGQWHPDRQAAFAKLFGHDIRRSTFEEQLSFKLEELAGRGGDAGSAQAGKQLQAPGLTAGQAGAIDSLLAERPGDKAGEAQRRRALAERLYQQYTGKGQVATAPTTPAQPSGPSMLDRLSKWWNSPAVPTPAPQGPQTAYSLAHPINYVPSAASRWDNATQSNSTDNSSETHITGPITIHTKATDARGIASSLRSAMADSFTVQANTGLA